MHSDNIKARNVPSLNLRSYPAAKLFDNYHLFQIIIIGLHLFCLVFLKRWPAPFMVTLVHHWRPEGSKPANPTLWWPAESPQRTRHPWKQSVEMSLSKTPHPNYFRLVGCHLERLTPPSVWMRACSMSHLTVYLIADMYSYRTKCWPERCLDWQGTPRRI